MYMYPEKYKFLAPLAVIAGVVFPITALFGAILPSIYILAAVGGGSVFLCVSTWYFVTQPASPPQPLSRNELRHLLGRTSCTFYTFVLLFAGLFIHAMLTPWKDMLLELELDLTKSWASIVVLLPMWLVANRVSTEPVKAGHVMSFFWCGALFSASFAGLFNTSLLSLWKFLDPDCHAELPIGPKWPFESPSSSCIIKASVQWILTPGIVEESLKFVVLTRLVTSVEEAVKSRALTRCPRMSGYSGMPCCGWFLKLAATPVVVVLSGMAVGAGFGTMENLDYIKKFADTVYKSRSILRAQVRSFTALLHIAMTGTSSFFLAVSMFHPSKRWCFMKLPGDYRELDADTVRSFFKAAACTFYRFDKATPPFAVFATKLVEEMYEAWSPQYLSFYKVQSLEELIEKHGPMA
ncbi:unnamed protein product [Symbiodinium natans]|uniref:Uncharacterized protein n=1 Tax=Symbiodinium natans TaxID=878477 RepID=A0A812SKI1_9DINO|nr:unnamed protein product [Symbiodinium natans]